MKIASATNVNPAAETVTLPLFQGAHNGQAAYYVVTDDSSKADAAAQGVNWSPKLSNALGTSAVESVSTVNGVVQFPGIVDFSPTRVVTPGPSGNEFPGGSFTPGAVGDGQYSPLITTGDGVVLNATQIADGSGTHDSVVSISTANHTVTLKSFFGFWNGHRTLYLHLVELRPEPERRTRRGDPLNIQQEIPGQGNGRYSPIWDVHPITWTQAAINAGQRVLLTSGSDVTNAFTHGEVTGGTGPANSSLGGLPAGGFISSCPIVAVSYQSHNSGGGCPAPGLRRHCHEPEISL